MDLHDFAYSYGSSGDLDFYDPYGGDYSSPTTTNINYDQYDPYGGDYTQPSTPNINYDEYDPYGGDTSGNAENIQPGMGTGGTSPGGLLSGLGADAKNLLKSLFVGSDGKTNPMGILGIGALMSMLGKGTANTPKVGYQGGIPKYSAVRQQIQYPSDPYRRPGSSARQYFTDVEYASPTKEAPNAIADAKARASSKAEEISRAYVPTAAPVIKQDEKIENPQLKSATTADLSNIDKTDPLAIYRARSGVVNAAQGGLMNLARGRYLNGSTDGMADKIPASIENKQPAALSHGEFVIPADVVSHLGNGNSEAGAQRLYDMMEKIRKARTGNPKQGKQIDPDKYMPK